MGSLFRFASIIGAVAIFAACGQSQTMTGASTGIRPLQLHVDAASTPWPGGAGSHRSSRSARYPQSSQPLLYVANDKASAVDIFPLTGPNQQQIGSISNGVNGPWGLSIDADKTLYVANGGNVTVYPYGATSPSMKYSKVGRALYALADSAGHVFVSGQNRNRRGHVLEFDAGSNQVIAHRRIGSEVDGIALDDQGNLYVAYRMGSSYPSSSIAEFGPGLSKMRRLGMTIDEPQGLLVDHAGNIIVVESTAGRIDVFPPGATTPSVTVTILGIGHLAELAMQNSETALWVSSEGGFVYSMPYPLTPSTIPTEYDQVTGESNGVAVSPSQPNPSARR